MASVNTWGLSEQSWRKLNRVLDAITDRYVEQGIPITTAGLALLLDWDMEAVEDALRGLMNHSTAVIQRTTHEPANADGEGTDVQWLRIAAWQPAAWHLAHELRNARERIRELENTK